MIKQFITSDGVRSVCVDGTELAAFTDATTDIVGDLIDGVDDYLSICIRISIVAIDGR